jgi:hypothetical protein
MEFVFVCLFFWVGWLVGWCVGLLLGWLVRQSFTFSPVSLTFRCDIKIHGDTLSHPVIFTVHNNCTVFSFDTVTFVSFNERKEISTTW